MSKNKSPEGIFPDNIGSGGSLESIPGGNMCFDESSEGTLPGNMPSDDSSKPTLPGKIGSGVSPKAIVSDNMGFRRFLGRLFSKGSGKSRIEFLRLKES